MSTDFIDEDELDTFEGWLRYQAIDPSIVSPEELAMLKGAFEEARAASSVSSKVGLMKLRPPLAGENRYAVVVREGTNLWLTIWLRRTRRGEYVILVPRADRAWDPHATYHLDGSFHSKSYGQRGLERRLQPLTGPFRGAEHLGSYAGYGPRGVGAICDPTAFTGVVEVPSRVLGPRHGVVIFDLVEPGHVPLRWNDPIVQCGIFRDSIPWVVIRVAESGLRITR
jgi:hypothetical protein